MYVDELLREIIEYEPKKDPTPPLVFHLARPEPVIRTFSPHLFSEANSKQSTNVSIKDYEDD